MFAEPTPLVAALDHIGDLESAGVIRVTPGRAHWSLVRQLCLEADARGNLVPDAAHAATAMEAGATWVSFDRDFARLPGLRWRTP